MNTFDTKINGENRKAIRKLQLIDTVTSPGNMWQNLKERLTVYPLLQIQAAWQRDQLK